MNSEKINLPVAIIVAGLLIGGAIIVSKSGGTAQTNTKKTVTQQIGINDDKLQACVKAGTYKDKVQKEAESGDRALAHLPAENRGTPYNVIINKAGVKVEAAGALPYEDFKKDIDTLLAGTATDNKAIALDPITADDHFFGNRNADVIIVEYSDLECPFCARVHPTIHKLITDYNGKVAWVYRHYPLDGLHPNARAKAEASECVWAQGGDKAFFKYADALFDSVLPKTPAFDPTAI